MKKYIFCLMMISPLMAFGANNNDAKNMYGQMNLNYDKVHVAKTDRNMYFGVHADLSFLNWKNKYKDDAGVDLESDKYSLKSMLGADASVGYKITNKWRVDGELGYMGTYSDTETEYYMGYMPEKTEFTIGISYLMANTYYNFYDGLYAGIGFGGALVNKSIEHTATQKNSSNTISPMGAIVLGWSCKLDEKIDFDLRYKLAGLNGGSVNFFGGKADLGFIMVNALSAGIRYNF